jgi:hypothetical protein
MVYGMGGDDGDRTTFLASSSFTYYNVNQYPGANFILPISSPALIDSSNTHTPLIGVWNANTDTQYDDEVVVYWSPGITMCNAAKITCDDPDYLQHWGISEADIQGYDEDAPFDWRIAVYQTNNGSTCNRDFGTWTSRECLLADHHCDADVYVRAVPIVIGQGNVAPCGTATADRGFVVYPQIRKSSDLGYPDLVVEGSPLTNFIVYAR